MTIEHTELSHLVSGADLDGLQALAAAVQDGTDRIKQLHPGYSWRWTDEIVCRGCWDALEIPRLTSTTSVADQVFADHQQFHLQFLLNDNPRYDG